MKKSTAAARVLRAARATVETLEDRRLLSAVGTTTGTPYQVMGPFQSMAQMSAALAAAPTATLSTSLLVFNDVATPYSGGAGASPAQTLTITNTGSATLSFGAMSIVNDPSVGTQDAAAFAITNAGSLPSSLAPGQSATLSITFTAASAGPASALLQIQSTDPGNPTQTVQLHGIGTTGVGGGSEPSLARILRAYDIPTIVGDGPNDANIDSTFYPATPDASSQEVPMPRILKAGDGPVTIQLLASFNAAQAPYVARFGLYNSGDPTTKSELFTLANSDAQTTNPTALGATSFDPGTSEFSLYTIFPHFTDNGQPRVSYSEDTLNTWDTAVPRKIRFFPLKNADGSVVPNAFVFAVEDNNIPFGNIQPYDSNDIVGIIRNVKAAPGATGAPTLGLQNMDGAPANDRLIFNKIEDKNPTFGDVTHDTVTLQLQNTGNQPLTITSLSLSNWAWEITNLPHLPMQLAPGATYNLQISLTAGVVPPHTDNQTNNTHTMNGWPVNEAGGVYNGTLTITSNDPARPARVVQLAGYWQNQTENENEPGLQTIVNLLAGYGTVISNTQQPNFPEGATTPTYYGEELQQSAFWNVADSSQPVSVIQLASFHNEADTTQNPPVLTQAAVGWYYQGSSTLTRILKDATDNGQTLFPLNNATPSTEAAGTFSPTGTFGWYLDGNYSDDSRNSLGGGGGHHVRFYPVRDSNGNLVPNEWLACLDYGSATYENYDFQDIVLLIKNVRPAVQPAAPIDAFASASAAGTLLEWAPNTDTVDGYNVYRSDSPTGTFVKLNSAALTSTAFLDTTAPAGVTSYYRIMAVHSSVESQGTGVMAAAIPAAPAALQATATTATNVQLAWTAPAGAGIAYRIERGVLGSGTFVEIASGVSATSFTDTSTLGNTNYAYQVYAENGSGVSVANASTTVTTPVAVTPSVPANLTDTLAAATHVFLTWSASTGPVTAYHIERKGPNDANFVEIVGNLTSTSYNDASVLAGASYVYRIRAENAGSMSGYSATLAVATPDVVTAAPTNLIAIPLPGGVQLLWTAPAGHVVTYHIERSIAGQTNFAEIAIVSGTTYSDASALPNTQYTYRVRTANTGGYSPYATAVSLTTLAAPGHSQQTAWAWGVLAQGTRHDTRALNTSTDKDLYYSFVVQQRTKITLKLTSLKDNTQLALLDALGRTVTGSASGKKKAMTFTVTLDPGTYFIKTSLLGSKGTKFGISLAGHYVKVKVKKHA